MNKLHVVALLSERSCWRRGGGHSFGAGDDDADLNDDENYDDDLHHAGTKLAPLLRSGGLMNTRVSMHKNYQRLIRVVAHPIR